MEQEIKDAVGPGDAEFLDATKLATGLMGDSIATNLFMVGYAYQRGLCRSAKPAILRAIELNGAAVEVEQAELLLGSTRRRRCRRGWPPRRCRPRRSRILSACPNRWTK